MLAVLSPLACDTSTVKRASTSARRLSESAHQLPSKWCALELILSCFSADQLSNYRSVLSSKQLIRTFWAELGRVGFLSCSLAPPFGPFLRSSARIKERMFYHCALTDCASQTAVCTRRGPICAKIQVCISSTTDKGPRKNKIWRYEFRVRNSIEGREVPLRVP